MNKSKSLKKINTKEYRLLLKKYFNFNIIDNINITENEKIFFDKYITKKITEKNRNYDFESHDTAITLNYTKFVFQIENFLIGVCKTPNNKEFIVGYKINEYYVQSFGTTISNWVTNFSPSESDISIKKFMEECNILFNSSMELYDPGEDESDWGFTYD